MNELLWNRIADLDFERLLKLRENDEERQIAVSLATEYKITLRGNDLTHYLPHVYCLAKENILDESVTAFLSEIDDAGELKMFANRVLMPLAVKQRKKTLFDKLLAKLLRRKSSEETETLSQALVEDILAENNIEVRLNLVTKRIEVGGAGAELLYTRYSRDNIVSTLPTLLLDICRERGLPKSSVTLAAINNYLFVIADANRYHPIRDMLVSHKNYDEQNLERVYRILGLRKEFDKTLVRKWLIQTVAFAFAELDNPVSCEGVLVLQGRQGNGKTSFFRKMAGNPLWFSEGAVVDMRSKDSLISVIGSWICELGEIDSTLKKEQSALKAFITRTIDRIRLPYAASESTLPRTTSMCGTVNPEQFLKDSTGNRRYWTVHVDEIDRKALFSLTEKDIFNIWGYVYSLYEQDKNAYLLAPDELDRLSKSNLNYSAALPFEDEVREFLDFSMDLCHWQWFTPAEIADYIPAARADQVRAVLNKIADEEDEVQKRRYTNGRKYFLPVRSDKFSFMERIGKRW